MTHNWKGLAEWWGYQIWRIPILNDDREFQADFSIYAAPDQHALLVVISKMPTAHAARSLVTSRKLPIML